MIEAFKKSLCGALSQFPKIHSCKLTFFAFKDGIRTLIIGKAEEVIFERKTKLIFIDPDFPPADLYAP